ncbi:OmpA family protein [Pseudenhygromyxa sp. WMMC2535]|uniref:OmpA family protein n=1 Tax=Pseudenhygromyxa sp. WMMC2535 TaxID=2712867 RepID=UPI0015537317|nr:OmpA family protein [Pseudenhygromyxa sp. WMMC2535]NVB42911.1 OmpA family protein [Pseudenhygromyxa sp. WMMC2535]
MRAITTARTQLFMLLPSIALLGAATGCKHESESTEAPTVETAAVFEEEEAAPAARVELRDDRIVIHEKIQFDLDKATIRSESDSLLRELAALIEQNPQLEQVSIEGHTCNLGSAEYNLDLSERRAKAVRQRLVREGVAAERLSARGYGLTQPLADNDDESGRETNRRVEFRIVSQTVLAKKVEVDGKTGNERVLEEHRETVRDEPAPSPTKKKRRA